MRPFLCLLLMTVGFVAGAESKPVVDLDAILSELAQPTTEEILFYRWQSTASGENLHKIGTMTEQLDKYFMAMQTNTVAGPGIYMAGHPESSSSYLPKSGGNLIEVRIKKGTPFLNLQDAEIEERLKERGITASKVMGEKIKIPVVMMYSRDWYVGKNLQEKAKFEMFPGPSQDIESLRQIYADLQYDGHAADQAFAQMKARRPDLLEAIGKNPTMGDFLAARVASPEKMVPLIRQSVESPSFYSNELIKTFLSMPDKGRIILSEPALAKNVKEKLISAATDFDFARIVKHFPEDWASDYLLQASEPAKFFAHYLEKINDLPDDEFVKRITRVEQLVQEQKPSGLSEEMKKHLEASVNERIALARQKHKPASVLSKLMSSNFIREDSLLEIQTRIAKTESYSIAFKQAFETRDRDSFARLLNETEGVGDFDLVVDEAVKSDSVVLKDVLTQNPQLYLRQLDQKPDIGKVMKVADKLEKMGLDVSQKNIDRFIEVGGTAKTQFIVKCIESDFCRPRLSGKWEKLLAGIPDLESIGTAVRRITDRQVARELEKEIFIAVKTARQMSSFAQSIFIRTRRDLLFDKIKKIGIHNFRPKDFDRIISIRNLSTAEQKTTLGQLIQGAVNAEDAIYLKKFLVATGLHKTELIRVLARKLEATLPTPEEVEKFESFGKVMGVKVSPSSGFDCLSGWARAMGL